MTAELGIRSAKDIVGMYPSILEKIKDNISKSNNAEKIALGDGEQKTANERYANSMKEITWLGEAILSIIEKYVDKITDDLAILPLLVGFISYSQNRVTEFQRVEKRVANIAYYYYDEYGKMNLVGFNITKNNNELEDLSYIFDRSYTWSDLFDDTDKTMKKYNEAKKWLVSIIETKEKNEEIMQKPLEVRKQFVVILENIKLADKVLELMDTIRNHCETSEDFQICSPLFVGYNKFLRKIHCDYFAFKVQNNL